MPGLVNSPLTVVIAPSDRGSARRRRATAAVAWRTKLLNGPPAKAIPPVTVGIVKRRIRVRAVGRAPPRGSSCRARQPPPRRVADRCGSAARPSTPIAGHASRCRRRTSETAWLDSSPTNGNSHRSDGTPKRRAVATEQIRSAAAWSTVHWLACHLLYGKASGRLVAEGVAISSASIGSRNAASGFERATRLKPAQSSATSRVWSVMLWPSEARRAFSIIAYWRIGSQSRWATSTGSSNGPGRRFTTSGSPASWSRLGRLRPHAHARGPSAWPRRPPPPPPPTRRRAPRASASSIRLCWGIPSSTRWVRASFAPTLAATSRAGSRYDQVPCGTAIRSMRSSDRGGTRVVDRREERPGHQVGGLRVVRRGPDTDQHRQTRVEGGHAHGSLCAGPLGGRRLRNIRPSSRQLTATAPISSTSRRARSGTS